MIDTMIQIWTEEIEKILKSINEIRAKRLLTETEKLEITKKIVELEKCIKALK